MADKKTSKEDVKKADESSAVKAKSTKSAKSKAPAEEKPKAKESAESSTDSKAETKVKSAQASAKDSDEEAANAKKEPVKEVAKAGKRSAKSLKETAEKEAKEARKASKETAPEEVKKKPAPKTRPRSERRGKNYKAAYANIDSSKTYQLDEALKLAVDNSKTKFDSTLELHLNLNVDPRQADQNIRGLVVLPSGSGKTVRVAVYAEGEDLKIAQKAGADVFGAEEFLQQLDKEDINFDVLVATPNLMANLSKYARLLGPKGLMPNPKSGTVTKDVSKAVAEAKAGKVEYRVDEAGIMHLGVGKVSFGADALLKNVDKVLTTIMSNKPSSVKGALVQNAYISTTMGPSIRFAVAHSSTALDS